MLSFVVGFIIGLIAYHIIFSVLFWLAARKNPFVVKMINKVDDMVKKGGSGKVEIISSFRDDFEKSEQIEDILL